MGIKKIQNLPQTKVDKSYINKFKNAVDDDVLTELINKNDYLRKLTKQINSVQQKNISGLMTRSEQPVCVRKIERIYSKKEIRAIVCQHLIAEYQHEYIIEAVTNYLYSLHVSK